MRHLPTLRFGLILLLLAIFVRSLIPIGFMPDFSSKKMALTICSGLTTKTIMVEDNSPSGHHTEVKHDGCPFAPPVLAGNDNVMDVSDYIKIAYAAFLPNPTAHLDRTLITPKTIYSQGPPENFVA